MPRDTTTKNNGANLGFEADLGKAADALRSNMDAAEYKHVGCGAGLAGRILRDSGARRIAGRQPRRIRPPGAEVREQAA
jgi:hypothetical protein